MGLVMGLIASAVPAIIGGFNNYNAQNDAYTQQEKKEEYEKKLSQLESSRQKVLNQSSDIRALKSQLYNPYANLGVATKAADLQMQQTDQALANTLDTLRETGAGGATALARMAAQSKAQISASLENQEAANQKLMAEGEAAMMAQKLQLDQAALGAEASAYQQQEQRDLAQLDRMQALAANAEAQQFAYQQQGQQSLTSGLSTAAGLLTSFV
jgi:chromosome segregation ATPase